MAISKAETAKVADLARLEFSDEELDEICNALSEMIDYADKLSGLCTDGVSPMAYPLTLVNVYREDEVRPSLSQEEALANAPDRQGEFFQVPKIVGSGEGDGE